MIDLDYKAGEAFVAKDIVFYRSVQQRRPEPQDFRHNDTEVIFAEYIGPRVRDSACCRSSGRIRRPRPR